MLKYLFHVEYLDGSVYSQTSEDISTKDKTRSAFFDVILDKIKTFTLVSVDGLQIYTVDLTKGDILCANTFSSAKLAAPEGLSNFRIIYYRHHEHLFDSGLKEKEHKTIFCLGWQANDKNGKSIKQILEIL